MASTSQRSHGHVGTNAPQSNPTTNRIPQTAQNATQTTQNNTKKSLDVKLSLNNTLFLAHCPTNKGNGVENHQLWQGQVYYIKPGVDYSEEAKRVGQDRIMDIWYSTGYSPDGSHVNNPLGLHGYNCRHSHRVWFLGASSLPDEQPEPQPVTINGKTYDYYAMTQKMRVMERNIRALKRELVARNDLKIPATEIKAKISQKTREYESFCKKCKVPARTTNLRVDSKAVDITKTKAYDRYLHQKVAERNYSSIVNKSKDGIIKLDLQFFASKQKQYGKKIGKHAQDFGLNASVEADRLKMENIISDIVSGREEIRIGTWRGQRNEVLFFVKGNDVVITKMDGEFVTVLKDGAINSAGVKNARKQ